MGDVETKIKVGSYRQKTGYTCGPAVLKIVLHYFGRNFSEKTILKAAGTTKKQGTSHEGLVYVLNKLGYKWVQKENATIQNIEFFIKKKLPVIVDYQAWHGGHYSVICGFDKTHLIVCDPAKDGGFRSINKKLFLKRWHDTGVLRGIKYHQWMMVVFPK